jgi:uncharacterized Zn finger protein (UPF0148 family)
MAEDTTRDLKPITRDDLLYRGMTAEGGHCEECDRVTVGHGKCPECETEVTPEEEIVSSIVLSAINQSAQVRYLPEEEQLPEAVSIAALNRF